MATLYTVQVSARKGGGKKLVDFFFSLSNTFTELFCNVHLKTPFIGHKQLTKCQIIILMLVIALMTTQLVLQTFPFYI